MRRAEQTAVERIRPVVIRTSDPRSELAFWSLAEACAAVAADVIGSAHLAGGIAQNDDAFARHIAHEVISGVENRIGPPGAHPVLAIERLQFLFELLRVGVIPR